MACLPLPTRLNSFQTVWRHHKKGETHNLILLLRDRYLITAGMLTSSLLQNLVTDDKRQKCTEKHITRYKNQVI